MNLPTVDTIHSQGNRFVRGVKIKASGDSKLNDSPVVFYSVQLTLRMCIIKW